MATIQVKGPLAPSEQVWAEISQTEKGTIHTDNGEISDAVAKTIASWYQSSGTIGSVLAGLASGAAVDRDALAEDVAATGRQSMHTHGGHWADELNYLATWVLNHA